MYDDFSIVGKFIEVQDGKYYDGFDISEYIVYDNFIRKKYFKIIDRKDDDYITITLSNNKIVKLVGFNVVLYTPISKHNKRKNIIDKIL
jgi:hypothetical protein